MIAQDPAVIAPTHPHALCAEAFAGDSAMPYFAVLLAAHNGMEWIGAQLDSILKQTGVRMKIYIGVDPSIDDTLAWSQAAASRHSSVEVLHFDEHSGGAASNFFRMLATVDFSGFDYVSLADQDDLWLPDKLARAHNMLSATGADAYSSNVIAFWASGRKVLIKKDQKQVKWDFLFESAGPGCTFVLRRDFAQLVQALIRERWNEVQQIGLHDWFVYAFSRASGHQWIIDKEARMLYRQHSTNEVGVNSGISAFYQRACKVLDGWGLSQSALIAQLTGLGNDPFVARWSDRSRGGMLWLGFRAWHCRRRLRDKFVFFFSCVSLAVVGDRHQY